VGDAVVTGVGLHSGAAVRVVLHARPGAVTLGRDGVEARVDELAVSSTPRATTVEARGGRLRVATVEHLFAALAGLGVYEGLAVVVDGPEMPLLDGGALAWCGAIDEALGPGSTRRAGRRPLRVARAAELSIGASRYVFEPGAAPGAVEVAVRLEFEGLDEARVLPEARWDGGADDFRARVAPARTFALARDVGELVAAGLARHVDPMSVVVLTPDAVHHAGRAFEPDEPARHKLLDLLGDLYVHGGPPRGSVRAVRPGHAANARAMEQALAEGIVVVDGREHD
jgi:UDP-3-O-[3-hydroxymyristoyl] N-acetylglucosamine deacetylase